MNSDDADDFGVDDVRRGQIVIETEPSSDRFGVWCIGEYLVKAGGVNDEHLATARATRRAPRELRQSKRAMGRRRVLASHSERLGRDAILIASLRSSSGTVMARSAASLESAR